MIVRLVPALSIWRVLPIRHIKERTFARAAGAIAGVDKLYRFVTIKRGHYRQRFTPD